MTKLRRVFYGDDPQQYGELHLASGSVPGKEKTKEKAGVVVVIHGGYWRSRYGAELGRPLAEDLAAQGVTAWNLEYRRAGNGGGWPETFLDVAAGIDKLAELEVDISRVVALGHSAGGQLAVWAAGRAALPSGAPGAGPAVSLDAVVSQSGLLDLKAARELGLSDGAVTNFLGGSLGEERYRLADPLQQLPVPARIWAVFGEADSTVPPQFSRDYVAAAQAAGARAELVPVPGDHMALIEVSTAAWAKCRELVLAALG
ncbi:acetyl esterase/lipase [Psychromicrobium silvestre]|uniref:Acetyl esterase/lipase n=1 Tax=Psychromicrobium silvestre TaxID=1645614 RepID=A0A7Y9S813_9MICC|nr:alpha/beta hydrolase [Psychromicrobium silvestre]NYE96020.1 acetyl esterase/lipase [Psychromicrobium silvestre]